MNDMANIDDSDLVLGFEQGICQVTSGPANASATAGERARAKAFYDKQRALAYDTLDPVIHLITRSALHDSALRLLSDRLAELTTVVYSDNDETTASKIRNSNKRLSIVERGLKDLRSRVGFLEGRVTTLARRTDQAAASAAASASASAADGSGGGGGGGGGTAAAAAAAPGAGRKLRSMKKRKARSGDAVDVSSGDAGGPNPAVAEELGEVESMLAEVMKRVGDFRIASGLDEIQEGLAGIQEEGKRPADDEDTEMVTVTEDKGKEVVKPEPMV